MPDVINSYIHTANQVRALAELHCQNKVTAMTAEFQNLAREIAMQIVAYPNVRYVRIDDIRDRINRQIRQSGIHSRIPSDKGLSHMYRFA